MTPDTLAAEIERVTNRYTEYAHFVKRTGAQLSPSARMALSKTWAALVAAKAALRSKDRERQCLAVTMLQRFK